MTGHWLYQVRIKVNEDLSRELRKQIPLDKAKPITDIASKHVMQLVCTYDAFVGYCTEAEKNGINEYPLYKWTKQTTLDPQKKSNHLKSFAFYKDSEQIYEKSRAEALYRELEPLLKLGTIEDLKLIDSNPINNPQPPS
ncbi:MAG: hypothetical protein CMM58_05325 [Rhodospirillaceae bacterium]|nr:hypothetical protein [Rhodospirillaceae bacterium]|tara:strand:+ start:787 stop:1203 length:417 start_codon:yes stop_codon:yes gene_type:complete